MAERPLIVVLGTGGTISGVCSDRLDMYSYISDVSLLSLDDLLNRVPEIRDIADVIAVPFRQIVSPAIEISDLLELANIINRLAQDSPGVSAFVITHGTSSLEETAFFLSLTVRTDAPVVLVGAMRPISSIGTDAELNLLNAVRVAANAPHLGGGVFVVLNDEIHAARDVAKTSNYGVGTFRTPGFGMLGMIDGDRINIYRKPTRRTAPETEFLLHDAQLPRVDIIPSYVGADAIGITASLAAGARGLICQGFPPGVATPSQEDALLFALNNGIAVVMCSRAGSGRVVQSSARLFRSGAIAGDNLSPQKARLLLMLGLQATTAFSSLQAMFDTY